MTHYQGLIAATFSPMNDQGELALDACPAIVDSLVRDGVQGLFVCGSSGEGTSLTTAEREQVVEAYLAASAGRLPLLVHVGHNSIRESVRLARHAESLGVAGIAAAPPSYFKPATVSAVCAGLAEIAGAAPDLPLFYYHIPALTGVSLPMVELLQRCREQVPSLAGIKFSSRDLNEFQQCTEFADGAFDIMFGVDEMLLSGLASGAQAAVGSTYNFAAPLYGRIIESWKRGDRDAARVDQHRAVQIVSALLNHGTLPSFKATMELLGLRCGPPRLPFQRLSAKEVAGLRAGLEAAGFFEHARPVENGP